MTTKMAFTRLAIPLSLAALVLVAYLLVAHEDPAPTEASLFSLLAEGAGSALPALSESSIETKKGRAEYFFRMLRDPATNAIPANIRQRELAYAKTLPRYGAGKASAAAFNWQEAGPTDVGGRTRGLAVDVTNSNVLLAGGVNGGIWKSTNGGATWTLKSDQHLAVTWLAQDPRPGQTNTWYATTGEFRDSSGDAGGPSVFGTGFYKSTDNGESWQLMIDASNPTAFDSPFDRASKVLVSPATGSVFVAANAFGILRSTDGGASFNLSLGGLNEHIWSDVTVDTDGFLLATLSSPFQGTTAANDPGIYLSNDDGVTWSNVAQGTSFPTDFLRSVIACAPSNPNVAYLLTYTGTGGGADEDVRFHKLDFGASMISDRSANLPNFGERVGFVDTQGAYNMVIAIKPDDENFVLFGTTNLFRSRDGFATPANDLTENWIGGYATSNDVAQYRNQHPDQHALVFDPANPNRLYSGHDGGISVVNDITTTADELPWVDLNQGYNVTQFYQVALPPGAGDARLLGGTQDNGSPFFRFDGTTTTSSDISSGDGGYGHFGNELIFTSSQNGFLLGYLNDPNNDPVPLQNAVALAPPDAANQLFVHPFAVDANGDAVVYYPAGSDLWRSDFSLNCQEDIADCWTQLVNFTLPQGFIYSAVAVTNTNPTTLYLGVSSNSDAPRVFRLDNAQTATSGAVDVSIPGAPAGAYTHAIVVNPNDSDEILVILSNYNIVGLYHSTDGGQSYTEVEGNLEGNASNPGPSIRSATILPFNNETTYLVGTSTGAYSTTTLNGANTQWVQEAAPELGSAIVQYITSRTSDGRVALATHGRGIFIGSPSGATAVDDEAEVPQAFTLHQNYPNPFNPETTIAFDVSEARPVELVVFDVQGRRVATLVQGVLPVGRHEVQWRADDLPSGTYFYQLSAGDVTETRKMVLVK